MKNSIKICSVLLLAFLPFYNTVFAEISAPTNVASNVTLFNRINLSWTASEGAVGYVVYANGVAKATTTSPAYAFPLITLPGNPYCFTVISYDADNSYSPPSSETCASIVRGTAIAATELATRIISSNNIEITWKYPLTQEQRSALDPIGYSFRFTIERSNDGGSTWTIIGPAALEVSEESPEILTSKFNDTSPKPGVENMYRVTALDEWGAGFSAPSASVTVTPENAQDVPTAPSNLAARFNELSSATSATIEWKDNSNDESAFIVEKKSGDSWNEIGRYAYANNNTTLAYSLSNLEPGSTLTVRVRAMNAAGLSTPSNSVNIVIAPPFVWTSPVASQHVLVLYNADDPQSVDIKNYYMSNRPEISNANVLGVHFPALQPDSGGFNDQIISKSLFESAILNPVGDWLEGHSSKPIRYVVMMYGMPIIVIGCPEDPYTQCGSVQYQISRVLQTRGLRGGVEYRSGRTTRFTPEYYLGTTALVTSLDMGSVAATKGYIDKLKRVYDQMQNKNVVISAKNAGLGGTTYYFEDKGDSGNMGLDAKNAVLAVNPSAQVMYKERGNFNTASNVLGYSTHATWGGLAKNFPNNGSVIFSGNSGWYLLRTGESWNGIMNNVNSGQSNPSEWFKNKAFGGVGYENTPVGAVTQVREPSGSGLASKELFSQWERGYLFAEAAWASRNVTWFFVVGDPLVANTGSIPDNVTPADTLPPVISSGSPSGTLPYDTTTKSMSVITNENAVCKFSTNPNVAFTSSASTRFSTTGTKDHSTTLTNLIEGTSYHYYIRCQDTDLNTNTTDFSILFAVAAKTLEPDTTKPTVVINYPFARAAIPEGVITISASASDIGGIAGVTFYVNGTVVGQEDTTSPYSVSGNFKEGDYKVYAVAKDAANNITTSATVSFIVTKAAIPDEVTPDTDKVVAKKLATKKPASNTKDPVELVYIPDPDSKIVDGMIVAETIPQPEKGIISSIGSFFVSIVSGIKDFLVSWFD